MSRIAYSGFLLDTVARTLSRSGYETQPLASQEMLFLEVLMRRPDTVIDHDTVLMAIYADPDDEPQDASATLRTLAHRIRKKAAALGATDFLRARPGAGYYVRGEKRCVRIYTEEQAKVMDALFVQMNCEHAGAGNMANITATG